MKSNDSLITWDEIMDVVAKWYNDTPEIVSIDSIYKNQNIKWFIITFSHYFISNHLLIIVNNYC